MFLGSKVPLVRGANNVTAIYEPIDAAPAIYFSGALHKHIIWADY
jgi:hypothetical protein